MAESEPANDRSAEYMTIELAPSRVAELRRLADDAGKDVVELAREFLETEIEAQYGLRYGAILKRFMYR